MNDDIGELSYAEMLEYYKQERFNNGRDAQGVSEDEIKDLFFRLCSENAEIDSCDDQILEIILFAYGAGYHDGAGNGYC
jgi:hypothetical protein